MGSGNDFARALGLKKDLTHLIESTKQALKEITVYTYQKGLVLNSLDLGFASWVINHVEQSQLKTKLNKYHLGKLTYILTAIQCLIKKSVFLFAGKQYLLWWWCYDLATCHSLFGTAGLCVC